MKHYIFFIFVSLFLTSVANAQKPKAMNLGLSVRWANMNVGASAPEEYGEYFAWGEVKTKRFYGYYSKYKYYYETNNGLYFEKYNYYHYPNKSKVDSLFTLTKDDDPATRHQGKKWRTPTAKEVQELIENCKFENATINRTKGILVSNKSGVGDTIFIPLTGHKSYGNFRFYPAVQGYYWTSTLVGDEVHSPAKMDSIDSRATLNQSAKCYMFTDGQVPGVIYFDRKNGCTIRAVTDEKK